MLKLNYTDRGLFLERITASLEGWVSQRAALALATGQSFYLEPSHATLLFSQTMPGAGVLADRLADLLPTAGLDPPLAPLEDGLVEVTLQGIWLAIDRQAEEGTFIAVLSPEAEGLIQQLWQVTSRSLTIAA